MNEAVNNVIIIGLLKKKIRNADNVDIQRPILDFEIIISSNNPESTTDIIFEEIPALLSNNALARSSAGFTIGDIFLIIGKIRNDDRLEKISNKIGLKREHYIEVDEMLKLSNRKKNKDKLTSMTEARVNLIKFSKSLNFVALKGTVIKKDTGYIEMEVNRSTYTRGDLTNNDKILVLTDGDYKLGETILCIGQICSCYMKPHTIVMCK